MTCRQTNPLDVKNSLDTTLVSKTCSLVGVDFHYVSWESAAQASFLSCPGSPAVHTASWREYHLSVAAGSL